MSSEFTSGFAGKYFSGGEALEKILAEYSKKVTKGRLVNIGFPEGGTYPDGTSIPMVAAMNEFGAPSRNQPPRPFIRLMIAKESPHWGADLGKALKLYDYDAAKSLDVMGMQIQSEMQQSINDLFVPPLAPSTIRRKGFDKPLVDTNLMMNTVTYWFSI